MEGRIWSTVWKKLHGKDEDDLFRLFQVSCADSSKNRILLKWENTWSSYSYISSSYQVKWKVRSFSTPNHNNENTRTSLIILTEQEVEDKKEIKPFWQIYWNCWWKQLKINNLEKIPVNILLIPPKLKITNWIRNKSKQSYNKCK